MSKRSHALAVPYEADLAEIHVEGYGFHWEQAAPILLRWFDDFGIPRGGKVVDLGCGGGQWLSVLAENGYEGCGIDVSEHMIRIAKRNASHAEYLCGSFDKVTIPPCAAATSLGEPLNYLNSGPAMRRTMRNVFAALSPGGVFIFDVRHPAKDTVEVRHHHKSASDWFCHARIEEDHLTNRWTASTVALKSYIFSKSFQELRSRSGFARLVFASEQDVATAIINLGQDSRFSFAANHTLSFAGGVATRVIPVKRRVRFRAFPKCGGEFARRSKL